VADRVAVPGWPRVSGLDTSPEFVRSHVKEVQFNGDTKGTSRGSHFVTFDPRPEPKIEDDTQTEAQDFLGKAPESPSTFSRADVSQGLEPRAESHSSFVRRTALRSAARCVASAVLPAPGNPQVRISRASLTSLSPAAPQAV